MQGLLSEDKFDSFNLPVYCPSVEELRDLIEENGCFDILTLESIGQMPFSLPSAQGCRAGTESILRKHLGDEIIEPLFDRYSKNKNIAGSASLVHDDSMAVGFFVLVKRKLI